jgi:mannobiose 2-epimerase
LRKGRRSPKLSSVSAAVTPMSARVPALEDPARREARSIRERLEAHLVRDLLGFWARARDLEAGGFFTDLDRAGRPAGAQARSLVHLARLVWSFAAAHRAGLGGGRFLDLAAEGRRALERYFWDEPNEGWRWSVERGGRPISSKKRLYGQAFAIFATAEFALASGDPRAEDLARRTAAAVRRRARHPGGLGFRECSGPAWEPLPGGTRELNAHLHLFEAAAKLHELTGERGDLALVRELRDLIVERMLDRERGFLHALFDHGLRPVRGDPALPETSYGHDIEAAWLLLDAAPRLGTPAAEALAPPLALGLRTLALGLDRRRGGVFEGGPRDGPATARRKVWWVQAEALVGFTKLHAATGDRRFLDALRSVAAWIFERQADRVHGEWFPVLSERGRVLDARKSHAWKSAYHQVRACLETIRTLG